jgi:hypothetical protein
LINGVDLNWGSNRLMDEDKEKLINMKSPSLERAKEKWYYVIIRRISGERQKEKNN